VLSLAIWDIESSARLEHDFRASVQRHVVWFLASFFINCLFIFFLIKCTAPTLLLGCCCGMDQVSAPTIGLLVHVVDMTSSGGGGGWCWAKVVVVTWLGETLAVGL
jgi:hypothetical protein